MDNLKRLENKLKGYPKSLQALNHSLEKDFRSGFYTMYTPEELEQALRKHATVPREGLFLPLLFVYNQKRVLELRPLDPVYIPEKRERIILGAATDLGPMGSESTMERRQIRPQ